LDCRSNKNNKNNNKSKENYPYDDDDDEDDYDYAYEYEVDTDLQENDMDEIDLNELGDLLEDTNNMPTQGQVHESHERHNQQMISESESAQEEFDPEEEEYQEEENIEPLQVKSKLQLQDQGMYHI